MSTHRLIFIGGLHRSGTSLLASCLGDHPQVSGLSDTDVPQDEGQHLQSVYPAANEHGGPGRFGFRKAAHLDAASTLVCDENARELLDSWSPYWDLSRTYLLEKSPPNLIRAPFLQALFPDASFVMMTRHPLVVSLATRKWSRTSLYRLLEHWLVCHEAFERHRDSLDRCIVISYEDFVSRPQQTLEVVYDFAGLPSRRLVRDVRSDVNEAYMNQWRGLQAGNPLYRLYSTFLTSRFEHRVARFGYTLRTAE